MPSFVPPAKIPRSVRRSHRVDFMIPLVARADDAAASTGTVVPGHRVLGDGSLAVPIRISRTGILEYTYEDGTISREYRSPEEVFDPRSLDSFRGITLTSLHPDADVYPTENVDPTNWDSLSIGHIGDHVFQDGEYVGGEAIIKDAQAIDDIRSGKAREASAGYSCGIVDEPGVAPDGQHYDALQVGIQANHVALGPTNWGRSGNDVRLYLDAKHGQARRVDSKRKVQNSMTPEELLAAYNKCQADLAAATTKITELEAQVAAAKGVEPATNTDDDAEEEEDPSVADASKTDGKKMIKRMTADQMFAKIERKATIVAKVRSITKNDSFEAGALTDRECIVVGLKHLEPKFDGKNKSTEYLRATLDHAHLQVAKERAGNKQVLNVLTLNSEKIESTAKKIDGKDDDKIVDHYEEYNKRMAERAFRNKKAAV